MVELPKKGELIMSCHVFARAVVLGMLLAVLVPVGGSAYLTDYSAHEIPCHNRPSSPPFLPQTDPNPIVDPVFSTTVTRRTDPSMSPNDGSNLTLGLRHEYPRYPVLNANNTQMVTLVLGGLWRGYYEVRDFASGAFRYRIKPVGDPEFSWHPTDPTRLFYRFANQIRIFHTDTGLSETVMTFSQYYSIGTNEEGRPSDNWRYYAFLGYHDSSLSSADIVTVDVVKKKVLATWSNAGVPDWVSMSPKGTAVVAMWRNGQGTRLYNRDTLAYVRTVFSDYAHSDFALDATGAEILVYQATSGKQINELGCPNPPNGTPIASARLSDGQKKILLGDCKKADWTPVITGTFIGWNWFSTHFSGIASRSHHGWVLVSTYSVPLSECPTQTTGNRPFAREIFWLKTDGSGAVKRLAHHHSDEATDSANQKDYWAEPHATSSWDGTIILNASVWQTPWTHYDLETVTGSWWP
jgi:hypothetical protein